MLESAAKLIEAGERADQEEHVNTMLTALSKGDFQQRWELAKQIVKLGESVVLPLAALIEQTATSDPDLCWFAARILSEFDHPVAITSLVSLLHVNDEDLNAIAADALGKLGTSAIVALTQQLQDPKTRLLTVQAFACIQSAEVIAPLQTVVNDPQPMVRAMAIKALSNFPDRSIIPLLVAAITDPANMVRREAVIGMGLVAVRCKQKVEFGLVDYSLDQFANLLAPLLFDLSIDVAKQAAIALGRVGNDLAAQKLFQLVQAPQIPELLKIQAIRSLGWINSSQALAYLGELINLDSLDLLDSKQLCHEVISSIGRIDRPELIAATADILIAQLRANRPSTRQPVIQRQIALNLGLLGDQRALEPLIESLATSDLSTQLHIIRALKRLNPQLAHQRLLAIVEVQDTATALQAGVAIALREWPHK
ncbi:PBS lyase HEAT domain protein repeat-containing protein [Thalassoporum mexicanum PCC 7367]|uniref:HEAT repeat domain-containing protein n=1 Tax=Thalassoporum mexicanum TaxID=3457544 RepID=UPI00029FCE55|nr:HEAT repeat domain-containing protein [Pseudanabaena sp. PCC 7367]AFY70605.1 PBS lyase HEAT domain protein repeat-containing protein [Pseudanabaena sp. PCC 7367]